MICTQIQSIIGKEIESAGFFGSLKFVMRFKNGDEFGLHVLEDADEDKILFIIQEKKDFPLPYGLSKEEKEEYDLYLKLEAKYCNLKR